MKKRCALPNLAVGMLTAVLLLSAFCSALAGIDPFVISQITQDGNLTTIYANFFDENSNPITVSYPPEQYKIYVGGHAPVTPTGAVQAGADGVAYTLCVDISKSISAKGMTEIKEALAQFVNGLGENSYARVLAIGSQIKELSEFTKDKSRLNGAISQLDRSDNKTFLYEGISSALNGYRARPKDLPTRSAIVVFSDGEDDSNTNFGEKDVQESSASIRVPIYAVGMASTSKTANLSSLGTIARQSGGDLFSHDQYNTQSAVQTIKEIVEHPVMLSVVPPLEAFGQTGLQWKVTLVLESKNIESKVYSFPLTLEGVVFPTPTPVITPAPTPSPTPVVTQAPVVTPVPTEPPPPTIGDWVAENEIVLYLGASLLLLIAGISILLFARSAKKRKKVTTYIPPSFSNVPSNDAYSGDASPTEGMTMPGLLKSDNPLDKTTRMGRDLNETVRLGADDRGIRIQFRIEYRGEVYEDTLLLNKELTIGRDASCTLCLADDTVSSRHAVIRDVSEGLSIEDNHSTNKTILNGEAINRPMPLSNGDVLMLGKTRLTIGIRAEN